MSGGLFSLLDDVAALAKATAASLDDVGAAAGRASIKATGVVVDDTAVTPQYVSNVAAARELPIIGRIARGSLRNKLVVILPVAILLSEFAPRLITPILMLGGTYLCFEGAEKVWHRWHHGPVAAPADADTATTFDQRAEEVTVTAAVRTDLILSTEIMVIALNEVADQPLPARVAILVVVALLITALVYGVVALIVKMDDVGLRLAQRPQHAVATVGRNLVRGMPLVLTVLSTVGVAAMLWVGGHIVLAGTNDLGWDPLYAAVHHLEEAVESAVGTGVTGWQHHVGTTLGWIVNTTLSALFGFVLGSVVVLVVAVATSLAGRRR